ncbi:glycosyl hydrolase family 18 protein [Scandinavium lactucae]|uniref:chitinase n=1 Tax=Scandinavium lactucae TaxID=3095028 RepID=A0ABU4QN35_9ENTR|nr:MULTISPECIES: glycosyl hydrolase family 18 protein [unclassified Scandinavium]MDX6040713.1 glycosyl hydrolase family 18 protein [Scandinavium sp. V105_6]MDX6051617.1 glycosyl hydrolase family 18 protein [Scandinavium sp. V105_1]
MRLNKLTTAILFSAVGFPMLSSAATVTANDQTNTFSGLDYSMMISKDGGHTWAAYTNASQNNFPGSVLAQVAAKQELAIISEEYDPNRTYKGGDTVRFLGYYWTAQWWVDQGVSPGTDPVWVSGDSTAIKPYATFQFTPFSGQAAIDLQNREKANVAAQRKVIGYFPEWGVYEAHNFFTPDKVDYSGLTHLNYGFAVVKDGVVTMHDTDKAPGLIKDLEKRTDAANVAHMISVGGWNNSQEGVFEAATATDAGTEKLANSMVSYMKQWHFDGVDIDWEYPDTEAEKAQFTKLIQSLRTKLDAQGLKDDKYYQLSAAVTTNHNNIQYINPTVTSALMDSVNVMAYDIHGAFEPLTGHNAPLFENSRDEDKELNVADTMKAYAETWKVPKAKLMMGIPYYGRGWGHVPGTELIPGLPGMFNTGAATVKGAWDDAKDFTGTNPWYVLKQKLASGEYTRYWDSESHVPYLYSKTKQEFLTYDDPQSIDEKVDYILDQGFGGAILWDISGDTPEHELGNIVKEVKNTPLPDGSDVPVPPDVDPIIDKTDLKGIVVNLYNGQTNVVMNLDANKFKSGYKFTASADGKYLFGSEGASAYYSYVGRFGKEVSLRSNFDVKSRLKAGTVITVTREYPNKAVLGELIVTQDMLDGKNPVISDGTVKSISVSKINNVPYVFVDFDKAKLHSADGSSYVAKVIDDNKLKGNYIFNCDNGKCAYSTATEDSTVTHVKSDEKDISLGETVVIERISPNPATIAKIVVNSFEPEPQPEPQPQPTPVTGLKATLFQNGGLTGDSLDITGDIACLTGVKMKNGFNADNEVSSLSLPKGSLGVRLFTDCQFKGTDALYTGQIQSKFDMTKPGSVMNKAVSSVQVVKAVGWDGPAYGGQMVEIMGDTPVLDGGYKHWEYMPDFGRKMSSIKVAEGYTARVYADRDYQGAYIDVKSGEQIPNLSKLSFDNKALSIKFFIDKAK